jgi:transcription initiation factor TFIIIB Brf1 subunit/transcription initiation factor TFIIB
MSLNLENGIQSDKASTLNSDGIRSSQSLSDISRMRKQRAKEKTGTVMLADTSIKKLLMCEACSTPLIPHDGFMVCRDCGLCQSRDIDTSQEWRNLDDNKGGSDPSRVSVPNNTLMPETSVGTMVSYGSGKKAPFANIIRTMNNWSMLSYKDSTILKRFKHITTVCKNANVLDSVIEEIKIVYFKISQVKAARRNKLQALMAVSVIIGHEIAGYERDYKEVADMFDIDIKVLRSMIKEYEFIWKELQDMEAEEQAALVQQSIEEESRDLKNESFIQKQNYSNIVSCKKQNVNMAFSTVTEKTKNTSIDDLVKNDKPSEPIITKETNELFKERQDVDNGKLRKLVIKSGISAIYHDKFYKLNDWIAERYILAQHIPKSRYACLIFLVSELYALNVDKHKIISLCETSNVTINKCYNKLAPYLAQIIDFLDVKNSKQ